MDQGFRIFQRPSKKDVHTEKSVEHELDDLDKKVEKLFSGQDLLFERLHTEPKLRTRAQAVVGRAARSTAHYVRKQPAIVKVAVVTVLALGSGAAVFFTNNSSSPEPSVSEVAGVSDTATSSEVYETVTDQPSFNVMTPSGKQLSDLGGRERKSPGGDIIYSFADNLGGTRIEVTQQSIPESFSSDRAKKLEDLAKGFNAGSIIQVDDTTIYHGYDDETKYQSLIFIKNDVLVFVLSPDRLPDDSWAAYVAGLY